MIHFWYKRNSNISLRHVIRSASMHFLSNPCFTQALDPIVTHALLQ